MRIKAAERDLWVPSHQSILNDTKTKRLARHIADAFPTVRELGLERDVAIGLMHKLWWWVLDEAIDGDLSRFDDRHIEDAVDWKGPAGGFVRALLDSELMDEQPRRIHAWEKYADALLKVLRSQSARAQRNKTIYAGGKATEIKLQTRARDGDYCRYCDRAVNSETRDRRSPYRMTYDTVDPYAEPRVTLENLVVCCGACFDLKAGRPLQAVPGMTLLRPHNQQSNGSGREITADPGRLSAVSKNEQEGVSEADLPKPAENLPKSAEPRARVPVAVGIVNRDESITTYGGGDPRTRARARDTDADLPKSAENLPKPADVQTAAAANARTAKPGVLDVDAIPERMRRAHELMVRRFPRTFVPDIDAYVEFDTKYADLDLYESALRYANYGMPTPTHPKTLNGLSKWFSRDYAEPHAVAAAAGSASSERSSEFARFRNRR